MSEKINAFLEKGNNRKIVVIVDAVLIAILSVLSLVFVVNILGADTKVDYIKTVLNNFLWLAIFGGLDFLLITFTKPLFGFTSVFENAQARKTLKAREKAIREEIERNAKETLKAAREARKAEKARNS